MRPSAKHLEPATPMSEYAYRVREPDGLPADCCGCTCAGGVIEKVAPASMTVSASPAEWRSGPGSPSTRAGAAERLRVWCRCTVCSERDLAAYVEPNVWVRHAL